MTFDVYIPKVKKMLQKNAHQERYSKAVYVSKEICPEIILYYPGRKNNGIDYKLELSGHVVTHEDIVRTVHNLSQQGYSYAIINLLVDIYQNGLNANHQIPLPNIINIAGYNLTIQQFKYLIFFTVLQEDLNYPRPRFFGIRMPFLRFIEASIASQYPLLISLDQVISRTNIRNQRPAAGFYHEQLEDFFVNAINLIV